MNGNEINSILSIASNRPLLTPDKVPSNFYFKRLLSMVELINNEYQDYVEGVWLLPQSESSSTNIMLSTTEKSTSIRGLMFANAIDKIFDRQKHSSDSYNLFYLKEDIMDEEDAENRERYIGWLSNSYTVYIKGK